MGFEGLEHNPSYFGKPLNNGQLIAELLIYTEYFEVVYMMTTRFCCILAVCSHKDPALAT